MFKIFIFERLEPNSLINRPFKCLCSDITANLVDKRTLIRQTRTAKTKGERES